MLSDPDAAYLVADSGEVEIGRVRLPLAQHPHLRRAMEAGEVTIVGGGEAASAGGVAGAADASAVFPVLVGRKPAGALVARFDGAEAARLAETSVGPGRVAASLFGIVLRGAKALEPLRERTRRVTLPDVREERRVRAIERYRAFIDSASDGIVVVDAAGVVLYMNRAAEEVTGYARDGLAGKPIVQIVPEPFRAGLERRIARAIAAEPVDNFDLDLITTSGDRITVSVASIAILSEHEAAIFSFRDVTLARELERELRRTSEFLKRILNSVVDGVIAANMKGTIVLFNHGAERICGYQAADVIGRISVKRLYPPGVAHEVMRLIRSAEHGGGGRLEPVRRDLLTAGRRTRAGLDLGGAGARRRGARDRDRRHLLRPARAAEDGGAAGLRAGEAGRLREAGGGGRAGRRRRARAEPAAHLGHGLRAGAHAQARRRAIRTCRSCAPSSRRPIGWRPSCASSAA